MGQPCVAKFTQNRLNSKFQKAAKEKQPEKIIPFTGKHTRQKYERKFLQVEGAKTKDKITRIGKEVWATTSGIERCKLISTRTGAQPYSKEISTPVKVAEALKVARFTLIISSPTPISPNYVSMSPTE